MPNRCSNRVTFSGDKKQLKPLLSLFRQMARKGKKEMLGQLPDFTSKDHNHCFDIYLEDKAILFTTKWAPDNNALMKIANHFNLEFVNRYDEPAMFLHGEAGYRNGELINAQLDGFDMQQYEFDLDSQLYWYQNG